MSIKILLLAVSIPISFFSCSTKTKRNIEYAFIQKKIAVDTSFIAKTSVDSICPCSTTLADLRKHGTIEQIAVEDMEQGKRCIGSDARFENDKGYRLSSTKGIIIQKDENTEYVAKIHLEKDFEGLLPNGQFVSLKNLKVRDVIKMYPHFNYGTRDCSDYWDYNNDTLNFYFKVDPKIKRYPLDVNYYVDMPIEGIDIVLWCYRMYAPDYSEEVIYERPLYAPLSETHVNAYVEKKRDDFATKIKEMATFGKKSNYDIIKLGKWLAYSPDHQLITEEYYDNRGNLIKKTH